MKRVYGLYIFLWDHSQATPTDVKSGVLKISNTPAGHKTMARKIKRQLWNCKNTGNKQTICSAMTQPGELMSFFVSIRSDGSSPTLARSSATRGIPSGSRGAVRGPIGPLRRGKRRRPFPIAPKRATALCNSVMRERQRNTTGAFSSDKNRDNSALQR